MILILLSVRLVYALAQSKSRMFSIMIFKPFSASVPLVDKRGSWFLLAKCLKNACGRVTF